MMKLNQEMPHVPSLMLDVTLSHDYKPVDADLLQTRAPQ